MTAPPLYRVDSLVGSDSNPGTFDLPWATTGKIYTHSQATPWPAGTRCWITPRAAAYAQTVRVHSGSSGTADNPIIVEGDPMWSALPIITPTTDTGLALGDQHDVYMHRIKVVTPVDGSNCALMGNTTTRCRFELCVLQDSLSSGLTIDGTSTDCQVRYCMVSGALNDGIDMHAVSTIVTGVNIYGCHFENIGGGAFAGAGDGVSFHEHCSGTIKNCVFRRIRLRGVANVNQAGSSVTVDGCHFEGCASAALACGLDGTMGTHIWINNVVLMSDTVAWNTANGHPNEQPVGMLFGGTTSGSPATIHCFGNTVYNLIGSNSAASYAQDGAGSRIALLFANNVSYVVGAGRHWNLYSTATSISLGSLFTNNNYFGASADFRWNSSSGVLSDWKSGTSGDANSFATDPKLVSRKYYATTPGAYSLTTDANPWPLARRTLDDAMPDEHSPLVGAGSGLIYQFFPAYAHDCRGRPRSTTAPTIGAHEVGVTMATPRTETGGTWQIKRGEPLVIPRVLRDDDGTIIPITDEVFTAFVRSGRGVDTTLVMELSVYVTSAIDGEYELRLNLDETTAMTAAIIKAPMSWGQVWVTGASTVGVPKQIEEANPVSVI